MEDKIKEIVAASLGLERGDIHSEAQFAEDLGADSLDLVEIIIAVEDEFHSEISDEAVMEMKCVADIVAYMEKQGQ